MIPSLKLVARAEEFFHELVAEALERRKLKPKPETEFYLVRLLSQFISADRLYTRDSEGHAREEPLAFMLKEAIEQPEPQVQSTLFRHVGDVSLYTAGYFQDSLFRKWVDVEYYIGLGASSYRQVAARSEESLKTLYHELSEKFSGFVDVLAEVSDKTAPKTEKDLLRLYDLWERTRSERAAKTLQEAGILTTGTKKQSPQ